MDKGLKFASYNCYGFKSSCVAIKDLCKTFDVICLQETWLFEHDLHMLSNLHPDFYGFGISGMDVSKDLITGRPYGGGVLYGGEKASGNIRSYVLLMITDCLVFLSK